MRRRLLYPAAGLLALGLLALVLAAGASPAFTVSLSLAAPGAERWLRWGLEEARRADVALPSPEGRLHADIYRPARPRGALLLVHGLSQAGRRQPDLARLARLLAAHGVLVVVPQFEGLAAFRLTGREVEEARLALRHALDLHPAAGIVGFSFGAGPALLAAAEVPGVRVVASFGGYADLGNVVRFVTTGVHHFGGQRLVQRQEEYNRWKLLALLAGLVPEGPDRGRLEEVARRRLANPSDDTWEIEGGLAPEGQSVLALVLNRREEAVAGLIERLPAAARGALASLSPLAAVPRLGGRLLIAHGRGDESIPFTESLRLAQAAEGRAAAVLFETFHHTGPRPFWGSVLPRLRDGWRLLRVVDRLLAVS